MDKLIDVLSQAARECGAIVLAERQRGLSTTDKDETRGAHFSTQADTNSQEHGIKIVRASFPDEVIIAEEQANSQQIPPNCTVFDPLDGTTNYFNSSSEFGVTLCTLRDGQLVAGALYYPSDNMLITAGHNAGCFINGERVQITPPEQLDKMMVGTDIGPWTDFTVLEPIARQWTIRSMMAGIYGARQVLLGQTGAYYNLGIAKIWDAAAGVLAVTEAGGFACDPWGKQLRWNTLNADWILTANAEITDIVIASTKNWQGRA